MDRKNIINISLLYVCRYGVCLFILLLILGCAAHITKNASDRLNPVQSDKSSQKKESSITNKVARNSTEIPTLPLTIKPYTCNGYTLNYREQSVLNNLLVSDIYSDVVSSDRLQSDYQSSEEHGDLKYKDATFIITGDVISIIKNADEISYFILKGENNILNGPHVRMADEFVSYLANLHIGQTVHLRCQCDGQNFRQ